MNEKKVVDQRMETAGIIEQEKNYIQVKHISKFFEQNGQELEVLRDINFQIRKGEFLCIVGGSGCGKSTLLRILTGLDPEHEGQVLVGQKEIRRPGKERGFVFQENRLFPWLTVLENVCFALNEGSREEKTQKAEKVIELVGLKGFEHSLPKELSGGMAQRANIARSLVNHPDILLLDEPFGALDAFTKIQLQEELIHIREREHTTMIMVTHDIEEAVYLADRILVLGKNPGTIRDIISVDLPRPRNRNDYYFTETKKRVFTHFFHTEEIVEDYNI